MAKNEAKIKFIAETEDFNKEIKAADSSLKEFRSELKLNDSQMKNTGKSTETLQERHKILTKQLDASRQKTEALSNKVEKAKQIYGENSNEVKKLQTQLNNARAAEEKIQAEINQTNNELKQQKTAFQEVSEKAELAGDKLSQVGSSMMKVTAGVAAVGAASIAAFNEVDEGADNAIKATGATGKAAEELEQAYKNVAGSVVGDFGDIGSAIGEVNTRFGFTGGELEKATEKFLKFANVTGVDATDAVKKVSRYMGDAGIDSSKYGEVLDNLTVAAQASGISIDTLTENLTKYGAPMRALGFETKESIAIFSGWEKAGVNTEIAFSGMKIAIGKWSKDGKDARVEFKKTLKEIEACPDIASATTKAIEVFGQKAGPDLADAIHGGRFEYEDFLKVIEGSKGALEGTFDETVDGGYELQLAMQEAKIALGEVGDTLSETLVPFVKEGTEALRGFADWWRELSPQMQKTAIGFAGVVAAIGPLLLTMGKVFQVVGKITPLFTKLSGGLTKVFEGFKLAKGGMTGFAASTSKVGAAIGGITAPIAAVIAVVLVAVAAFATLWKTNEEFRNNIKGIWGEIKATFDTFCQGIVDRINALGFDFKSIADLLWTVWKGFCDLLAPYFQGVFQYVADTFKFVLNIITSVLDIFIGIFTGNWEQVWQGVKGIFTSVWTYIVDWFKNIGSIFTGIFDVICGWFGTTWSNVWKNIKNFFVNTWNSIVSFFRNTWNNIKNTASNVANAIKSKITSVWNGIKSTTTSVWNNIRSGISNVVNGIKTKVTSTFNSVKNSVINAFNNVKSKATSVWNGIKSAITTPIEAAKNKVKSVVDSIKGFFSGMKLSLPKIKLPHFKVTGKLSLNPPSVPKLKIDWYKNGAIFAKPTIFNTPYGMKGVGEAGKEAVLPIDNLQGYIEGAIEKTMQGADTRDLARAIADLANRPVDFYLDSRKFASATASASDNVGGLRTAFKSRGLAIN